MPDWRIKAAIQGACSLMPDPQRWNGYLQKYVTGSAGLSHDGFLKKWTQAQGHVERLRARLPEGAFTVLELGTGWYPIVPLAFVAAGASWVRSIDVVNLSTHERVVTACERMLDLIGDGRIQPAREDMAELIRGVLARRDSLDCSELLAALGIEVVVADARQSGLEDRSIDLICSNNTLEHIPREVLVGIFGEFGRLISPRGFMSHHIDLADHYAGFDSSITVYNFLRYSERRWRLFNNSLQYQNRLRVPEYRAIHEESGWSIVDEQNTSEPPDVLAKVPVSPHFARFAPAELAVYDSWMTSER